jgi:hypothetical protein
MSMSGLGPASRCELGGSCRVLAGVEPALNAPAMRSPEAKKQIPVCNVSGKSGGLSQVAEDIRHTCYLHSSICYRPDHQR